MEETKISKIKQLFYKNVTPKQSNFYKLNFYILKVYKSNFYFKIEVGQKMAVNNTL